MNRRRGAPTSTSAFGVGARESHDAGAFYARFTPRTISDDTTLAAPFVLAEPLVCGDARTMEALPDNSVALVVTSPPYFAGKEYEEALGEGVVPASYAAYLQLLTDVFTECRRVLEPGGRIAVNVANLGRKPYRSLAGDVARILDDDLGLLLRGEIVWKKAEGASGSCAWGSFRSPANPVLRDITERVVVASKGRFDRALDVETRRTQGRPHIPTVTTDEFLAATLDVWELRPESARRVGHPAPFPVELPQRLIDLYTFRDDLVLDPFLGSGSTAVAAVRTGRRFAGYDADAAYVRLARDRVREEQAALAVPGVSATGAGSAPTPFGVDDASPPSVGNGKAASVLAVDLLVEAGFVVVERGHRVPGMGVTVDVVAEDAQGGRWFVDVTGAFTSTTEGLARTDTLWKALGRASVLKASGIAPVLLLSTCLPPPRSAGVRALRRIGPDGVHDVMAMLDGGARDRLARYATGGYRSRPLPGFWSPSDLEVAS